jgi:hypothetical protein
MKPHPGSDKPLSKTALKNQRKHEAKKAAKQVFGVLISSNPFKKIITHDIFNHYISKDMIMM